MDLVTLYKHHNVFNSVSYQFAFTPQGSNKMIGFKLSDNYMQLHGH